MGVILECGAARLVVARRDVALGHIQHGPGETEVLAGGTLRRRSGDCVRVVYCSDTVYRGAHHSAALRMRAR